MRRMKPLQFKILTAVALLASPAFAANESPSVTTQLRAAVDNVQKKLSIVEPWQKKIFDEEVVPQYQRFVRDYRPAPGGLNVDVDQASIQDYIRFFAPKALNRPEAKIAVYIKTDSDEKSKGSYENIKRLIQARLERRGFTILIIKPEEVHDSSLAGKAINDHILDMATKRGAVAAFSCIWNLLPPEEGDSAHADESHYQIQSFLQIKEIGRAEGSAQLMDTDSFEMAAARMITENFTEIGKKMTTLSSAAAAGDHDEMSLEISGISQYAIFAKLKAFLSEKLTDLATIEERRLTKSSVTFALYSKKSTDEIKSMIEGPIGDKKLVLTGSTPNSILMVVR